MRNADQPKGEGMRYELQTSEPYPYLRGPQLRKNMTNLPERWKGLALSDSLTALSALMTKGDRIIDRASGEIVEEKNGENL